MAVFWMTLVVLALHGGLTLWAFVQEPFCDDKEFQDRFEVYRARWTSAQTDGRKMVVVVGSSRIEWGVRAQLVEHLLAAAIDSAAGDAAPLVHNFGFAGAGPLRDWAIVRRLLASSAPPDYLVLEINPMFCGSRDGAPFETPRLVREKLLPVERRQLVRLGWKQGDPSKWSFDDLCPNWHRARAELLERIPSKSLVLRKPAPPRVDAWGDSTVVGASVWPKTGRQYTELAHKEYFDALQNLAIDPTALAVLDDIVATCRAKGVPLALLIMPESDYFRAWYGECAHKAVSDALDHFRGQQNVACFDARTWLPDLSEYFDSHHLLNDGARTFSRRFADECLVPWMRGAAPSPGGRAPFQTTSFPRSLAP
jgi:hypothetical protein